MPQQQLMVYWRMYAHYFIGQFLFIRFFLISSKTIPPQIFELHNISSKADYQLRYFHIASLRHMVTVRSNGVPSNVNRSFRLQDFNINFDRCRNSRQSLWLNNWNHSNRSPIIPSKGFRHSFSVSYIHMSCFKTVSFPYE